MPARPNTDARRAEIAAALGRVMSLHGYAGTSVAAIAREAGLASGLVHYHFASKAEVLEELVAMVVQVTDQRIEQRVTPDVIGIGRVDVVLGAVLDVGSGDGLEAASLWTQIGAEAIRNEDVQRLYEGWVSGLHRRLQESVAALLEGDGALERGGEIAVALVALCEGYFGLSSAAPSLVAPGTAAGQARRVARALIAADRTDGDRVQSA